MFFIFYLFIPSSKKKQNKKTFEYNIVYLKKKKKKKREQRRGGGVLLSQDVINPSSCRGDHGWSSPQHLKSVHRGSQNQHSLFLSRSHLVHSYSFLFFFVVPSLLPLQRSFLLKMLKRRDGGFFLFNIFSLLCCSFILFGGAAADAATDASTVSFLLLLLSNLLASVAVALAAQMNDKLAPIDFWLTGNWMVGPTSPSQHDNTMARPRCWPSPSPTHVLLKGQDGCWNIQTRWLSHSLSALAASPKKE